jgi:hypothetical protein
MKAIMKTKTPLFIFLLFLISILSINAQPISELTQEQLQEKVNKFKGLKTTGIVMTVVGIPTLIAGIVIYVNGLNDSNLSGGTTDYDGKVWGGLALMVVGELATGGGIVLWAIGGNKVKKYNNELNKRAGSLSLKTGKDGIGLVYRF